MYYVQDVLGNVVALTDGTGAGVEGYLYQAYGSPTVVRPGSNGVLDWGIDDEVVSEWSGIESASLYGNPFLYTGQPYDADLGLYYYRARYYDPAEGRFLSRDPIGVWGDANNLGNAYAYVADNPLNNRDPTGQWMESAWDLASLGMGWISFMDDVENERWGWAIVDVLGMIVDEVALVLPIAPAFVGASVRVGRGLDKAVGAINVAENVEEVGRAPHLLEGAAKAAIQSTKYKGLRQVSADWLESPAGLRYGPDPQFGNRAEHVLSHTRPDVTKPVHSVFSGPADDVFQLLDEAWKNPKKLQPDPADPRRWEIAMGRVIGTNGESSLRIIVEKALKM